MKLYWTKRGIPHGFFCDIPIHLIYRLNGCAPLNELKALSEELGNQIDGLKSLGQASGTVIQGLLEEHAKIYDDLLDAQDQRKFILHREELGGIVLKSWLHLSEQSEILLYAVCVMGNHVHVLLKGLSDSKLNQIGKLIQRHKSFTTTAIKKVDSSVEKVWDSGFYDRYVREGSFWEVLKYILDNPVKAGLVAQWKEWPLTFVDPRCLDSSNFIGS
ncbi:MAG: transposase [Saprospiraceae bacterium]